MTGLDGKVTIVTGGGSGLGEAIGKALGRRGTKVVLSDINLKGAERVVEVSMRTETTYLGIRLEHPFIAGASPLGYSSDRVKRLEDAGYAAVVLHSLFEEQITFEEDDRIAGVSPDNRDFADIFAEFPRPETYPLQPDQYAEHIHQLKKAVRIPVIGVGVAPARPGLRVDDSARSRELAGAEQGRFVGRREGRGEPEDDTRSVGVRARALPPNATQLARVSHPAKRRGEGPLGRSVFSIY